MKSKLSPFLWSSLVMLLSLAVMLYVAFKEKNFFEANQIVSPDVSVLPAIAYFFGTVVILALILFIIPLNKLRLVFRALFTLMFGWGVFIVIALVFLPVAAYPLAIIAGIAWLFWDRIWLHDLLFLITLAGAGAVFGFLFSPLTFIIFMLVVAIYDFMAVRFGFMIWMADKLSESTTLPAFIFPKTIKDWGLKLRDVRISELKTETPEDREYAIVGGGDIGFPLMLSGSVSFASGLSSAIVVGIFALLGLMSAFLIQMVWLKGKPIPALPPIALFSLLGFIIANLFLG
ncbi:MAG: presenilin family intramembrane aspartyl protease [Chloroflexota bacterium]